MDSTTADSVVPVIWRDVVATGNTANQLNLDADDEPTEPFGIAGVTTYVPAEAAIGFRATDEQISFVDKTGNVIMTSAALYNYDSNDR